MENSIKFIVTKENILHNFNQIKNCVGNTKICAVVKANAYGIGVKETVKVLSGKCDFFAVSNCVEAREVRKIDKETPILVLMPIINSQIKYCSENNISITVQNSQELLQYSKLNLPLKVHIKINSGLNRFGEKSIKDFLVMQEILLSYPNINFEGIFTHFASADRQDETFFNMQFEIFKKYLELIYPEFNPIRHCCNTAGALKGGEKLLDMVRIGKGLYGYNPISEIKHIQFKPVLEISTRILNIFEVSEGEFIGYNTNYKTKHNMRIATIQIGFADGFKRCFSNKGKVIINNTYCNIVGNVCMDSCMVDVTHLINLKIGDKAIILGKSKDCQICAAYLAELANTTIYEILCTIHTKRIKYISK